MQTASGDAAPETCDGMQEAASLFRLTKDQGSHRPELDRIKQALAEDRQNSSFPGSSNEDVALDGPVLDTEAELPQ